MSEDGSQKILPNVDDMLDSIIERLLHPILGRPQYVSNVYGYGDNTLKVQAGSNKVFYIRVSEKDPEIRESPQTPQIPKATDPDGDSMLTPGDPDNMDTTAAYVSDWLLAIVADYLEVHGKSYATANPTADDGKFLLATSQGAMFLVQTVPAVAVPVSELNQEAYMHPIFHGDQNMVHTADRICPPGCECTCHRCTVRREERDHGR